MRLKDSGVQRSDLAELADQCFTKERMKNFIVDLKKEEVVGILESIY